MSNTKPLQVLRPPQVDPSRRCTISTANVLLALLALFCSGSLYFARYTTIYAAVLSLLVVASINSFAILATIGAWRRWLLAFSISATAPSIILASGLATSSFVFGAMFLYGMGELTHPILDEYTGIVSCIIIFSLCAANFTESFLAAFSDGRSFCGMLFAVFQGLLVWLGVGAIRFTMIQWVVER